MLLPTSQRNRWSGLLACRYVTGVFLFAGSVAGPALAVDTADETRAMSRQVSALIKSRNLSEAEALAKEASRFAMTPSALEDTVWDNSMNGSVILPSCKRNIWPQ